MTAMASEKENDFYYRIEALVYDAIERGAVCEVDVFEYVSERMAIDPLVEQAVKTAITAIVLFRDCENVTYH
jgi:hypothetical protein